MVGTRARGEGKRTGKTGALLFVLPLVLVFVLLLAYPIGSSVWYSFTNKNLIRPTYRFVGLANYLAVLRKPEVLSAFVTSVKWTVCSLSLQLLVGFTAALALDRVPRFKGFFRTVLIIPWAFPSIVIAFSWKWILNDVYGFLPNMLVRLGLAKTPPLFLADPSLVFWTVVAVNVWFGAPLFMVNVLSALQTIPREQYEAAQIDGASALQSFRHITLRHIRGVVGLLLVLRTIWVFNNFEMIYLLTGGGPSDFTTTLPILAYRMGWGLKQLGMASAVTVLLLIFLLAVSAFYFRLLDRWEREDLA